MLYSEILTDEIGHVGYCASRCTSGERAIMRRIYPLIGRPIARQTAEIDLLIDPKVLRARLDRPFDLTELGAELKPDVRRGTPVVPPRPATYPIQDPR